MESEKNLRLMTKIYKVCKEMLEDGESNQQVACALCVNIIMLIEQSIEGEIDPYHIHGKLNCILHIAMNDYTFMEKEKSE